MTTDMQWIIAGLGNPDRKYSKTRHNIGFMVVDRLSEKYNISLTQKKFDNLFGMGDIDNTKVILSKPMAYMNRSGSPLLRLIQYFKIKLDHVLVIHDDIDILLGNIKIKSKGGHGGHNGIKSIIDTVGGGSFPRIRVGIGRPPHTDIDVSAHVLGRITADEMKFLDPVLSHAENAAQSILKTGLTLTMNKFNRSEVRI